jgi:hypothetical protein
VTEERGEMGRRCLGVPVGYSEVRGKRRVPCVEARIMAMYSGSAMVIDQRVGEERKGEKGKVKREEERRNIERKVWQGL